MQIRLNKFLAQRGIASRRKADELIAQGRVSVNDQLVENLGVKIDEV
jgi:23S rRNA pseudouridine2605 synthase